ncbi:hypothetical protein OGAPHI_005750 [Ogataea philodendri]|uniref:Uncharacterized protein n=1 Tax=Ogataea philodendri TaxID=1378263 RepID=A0A9P8NYD4_9ASCO|nr:uncharacterized protein OGAPHI_005750 [Ogataea philodendri]KAH3662498.1 hypothetical protein OGAPHI_005750 [Ogataea philodendri]
MKWWTLTLLASALANSAIDTVDMKIQNRVFDIIEQYNDLEGADVQFEEWISPENEVYIVPKISTGLETTYGYGYQYFDNSDDQVNTFSEESSPETSLIKEQDISALGFPNLWHKIADLLHDDCEEEPVEEEPDIDSQFPYGARKFLLIGVKKKSVELGSDDQAMAEDADLELLQEDAEVEQYVAEHEEVSADWLPWKKKKEDDCGEEEEETKKPFGADKFLFIGIGSVDNSTAPVRPASDADLSPLAPLSYASTAKAVAMNEAADQLPASESTTLQTSFQNTATHTANSSFSEAENVYISVDELFHQFQNKSNIQISNEATRAAGHTLSLLGALVLIGSSVLLF